MCKFCENIHKIKCYESLKAETNKISDREKIVMVNEDGQYRLYGFNKYHYEDDSCYRNVEVNFCPVCGRDLRSEENE